ncbi:MAG: transcription termination factor Rho [Lachnospiraceae bacterium]|nr:transcription termination factor Rho [Lachnospiraceae bacterium]
MREKLETLPVKELREIAKQLEIKSVMKLKKTELIEEIIMVSSATEPELTKDKMEGKKDSMENNAKSQDACDVLEKEKTDEKKQFVIEENPEPEVKEEPIIAEGILEVMPDGYGFIRCENFLPGENDVYVSPSQIRRFKLKTGDILNGDMRQKNINEKFGAMTHLNKINGITVEHMQRRPNFEDLTPIFPDKRLRMETSKENMAARIVDLISPIGKGQRGMIVSPPKAGKTTLLKQIAGSILVNNPDMHMIILLIDERPEEVTDIREAIHGANVEVIYSTFDELPEHHKRVSEMVIERAKRLVEMKQDVIILLDSITRLARAYNMTIPPSGRTLSGGLDPAALHMPKKFFGAARNMREGGSLTILATAFVDTGSKMDDVVFEEFKGTGNMELVLDRKLQERRVFPAIDIVKSGTRREDLLLSEEEREAVYLIRKSTNGMKAEESVEKILDLFSKTKNNREFVQNIKKCLH